TGVTLRNLSAQVRALRLVTEAGEIRELDGGDELLAARVALGALGIVTEVTLQTVPAFTLRGLDAPVRLSAVLEELSAHVDGHRHFEFFVFPHADSALTRTNDAVEAPPRPRSKPRAYVDDVLLANRAFHLACLVGRACPGAIPSINRLVTRL